MFYISEIYDRHISRNSSIRMMIVSDGDRINLWLEYFQYIYRFTKYRYMKENVLQDFLRFESSIRLDILANLFFSYLKNNFFILYLRYFSIKFR